MLVNVSKLSLVGDDSCSTVISLDLSYWFAVCPPNLYALLIIVHTYDLQRPVSGFWSCLAYKTSEIPGET